MRIFFVSLCLLVLCLDEECDLDTLTALLEDSDNEIDEEKPETKPNETTNTQNIQDKQSKNKRTKTYCCLKL